MIPAILIFLTLGGISNPSSAIATLGVRTCGNWVKEAKTPNSCAAIANQSWLVGYITGLAVGSNKDFLKDSDTDSLFLWVTNYCQKNPLEKLDSAGYALAEELIKKMP